MENLRISTITCVAELNTHTDLDLFYKHIDIDDKVKYIEKGDLPPRGEPTKKKRKSRSSKKNTVFFNQVTIHYFHEKMINIKIFNNGKIQMTGLKYESQGKHVIKELIQRIIESDEKNEHKIFLTKQDTYTFDNYRIVLINSDFDCGNSINRETLQNTMIGLDMFSSFEPCIYPGVYIKYFYNTNNMGCKGVCNCERKCDGKGNGIDMCRRVTIAVFNSGKIIITGGRNKHHIQTAYEFITEFIEENKEVVLKKD